MMRKTLVAIEARHHHIEEDQTEFFPREQIERLLPASRQS